MLESKGLKVNISKMKVMRCAWDVAPKEAAVNPCSVCGKRVGVNSIQCATCKLLGAWMLFGSTGKFGESGTWFCVQNVQR